MQLCIFNPEHDLCLAKGRAHYVPPRSAVEFALRDASLMQVLYPEAVCLSVYDPRLSGVLQQCCNIQVWGWDAVVKHELLKRGCPEGLLPSDDRLATIRRLQHRTTVLPLQEDCHAVTSVEEMERLLRQREHWVMKAPWSGAGRGLRWVHGALTAIDRDWLLKTVATQQCVVAEPRREVVADVALEYMYTFEYLKDPSTLPLAKGESPVRGEGVDVLSTPQSLRASSPVPGEQLKEPAAGSHLKDPSTLPLAKGESPARGEGVGVLSTPQSLRASSPVPGEQLKEPEAGSHLKEPPAGSHLVDPSTLPLAKGESPARGEGVCFMGYSYFRTGSGVYKENVMWSDAEIVAHFSHTDLQRVKARVEEWLVANVWPRYHGPLGVDLMVCGDGSVHVAEINFRHTMGMIAHAKINKQ